MCIYKFLTAENLRDIHVTCGINMFPKKNNFHQSTISEFKALVEKFLLIHYVYRIVSSQYHFMIFLPMLIYFNRRISLFKTFLCRMVVNICSNAAIIIYLYELYSTLSVPRFCHSPLYNYVRTIRFTYKENRNPIRDSFGSLQSSQLRGYTGIIIINRGL